MLQRIEHKVCSHRTADTPAHDAPGKHIDHKGHVLPTLPSADVGEVRHPQLVRPISLELAVDPVQRTRRCFVKDRGADDFASANALQTHAFHESLDRAAGHFGALSVHLVPDLISAVDLHVGLPDSLDLRGQHLITLGSGSAQFGFALAGGMAPVARRGDLQHFANRLDPVSVTVLVDKCPQDFSRRSSSAWAKKALASLRISLALRSSLFSRSRSLMRARSSELMPSRTPASTSCWRTQSLRVWGTQPILGAMDSIVAHRDGCSLRCSSTMRTARSRTSGEKRFDFLLMAPSSQSVEPPQNPGRFITSH